MFNLLIFLQRKAVKISKPKVKSNFAAFRELMMKQKSQVLEVKSENIPENSGVPVKTFHGGFFAVSSPVQSPTPSSESSYTFRTFFLTIALDILTKSTLTQDCSENIFEHWIFEKAEERKVLKRKGRVILIVDLKLFFIKI